MKSKLIVSLALLFATLSLSKAQTTTLTAWTFDNLSIGANSSPQPSTGLGTAGALGMSNSYNNTNSVSNPDIQSLPGSSSGFPNSWQIIASGAAPDGGNGWSTNAPIGSQGAQFFASTFGYYNLTVSFDVYATPDAEANLQVQYTTGDGIWNNATITSVGSLGTIANNLNPNDTNTVQGSYVILTNNGTTGWNNQITVNLSGLSGVDNNPNFGIRLVNASTGPDCLNATNAPYDNTSGSWSFDNVVIQGVSFDTIADWTFTTIYTNESYVPNPVPEINDGNYTFAQALGFNVPISYEFANGVFGSTNDPDITGTAGSSTPNNQNSWRVRGQGPGNGWNTATPIGGQGAEFDASTINFSNIICTFDLYFTSQGEAKVCVEYTTNAWGSTNIAQTYFYGANPTFMQTNADPISDPNTVAGVYFYQTTGQGFYNNMVVDFTGLANVDNNPQFGFRVVDAATGGDCVAYNGGSYNNSSGNWRFANVAISGEYNGQNPPVVTNAPVATVDNAFTNTFTDNPAWRAAITSIYVNGTLLTNTAYNVSDAAEIIFTPSASAVLQTNQIDYIVIDATGYRDVKVTQPLLAGVPKKLTLAQPTAPTASGGTLVANPTLAIVDQYGNGTTNSYPNVTVTATAGGTGGWILGGATTQSSVNGFITFTNLSAANITTNVTKAFITFTISGYTPLTSTNSSTFSIGSAPVPFTSGNLAVIQIDTLGNNTTFSMLELKPSATGQKSAVNTDPISASDGTNSLRLSSAGSCGKLALSDDGTLLTFAAFQDGSSATPDETLNLNRAVGTLNYTNLFTSPVGYVSTSLGGSQARSACTPDDINYVIADKGGIYLNSFYYFPQNCYTVRSFGQTPYVQTQKTSTSITTALFTLADLNFGNPGNTQTVPGNLPSDPIAEDFYLIATNGQFNILYILDQVSSTEGIINKYYLDNSGNWDANGSWTNADGGDTLFACTNGSGAVYLYYANGGGGTGANSLIRLTDAGGVTGPLNITSTNTLYTASKTTSIEGVTFVPVQNAYSTELTPPPILAAQAYVATNGYPSFSVTTIPDDPAWRSAITGITVNGTVLPTAAYNTTVAGALVFTQSQSALLQSPGTLTINISATGYSTNTVSQIIVGAASQLVVSTQPAGPVGNGGTLVTQPGVSVEDKNKNVVITATPNIVAQVGTNGTWTIGGTTTVAASAGVATFSGLTASSVGLWTNANISFTSTGLTSVKSSNFIIPAPIRSVLAGSVPNGSLFISFTNATGLSYSVRATNNLQAPFSTWPVIGSPAETPAGSGHYQFTDPNSDTNANLFYILTQP